MKAFNVFLHIFLYVVVVCPINEVLSHVSRGRVIVTRDVKVPGHTHNIRPCAVCPRHGRCVPRIQCPAVIRPASYNPECHLDSSGTIGVCCFTGDRHAFPAHTHNIRPCAVCPRHGRCVPRIQCPAIIRPASYNPECHLDSSGTTETELKDLKQRSSSLNVEDLKTAQHQSQNKLQQWMTKAEKLVMESPHTVVNRSSPSFAHHLSMVTNDHRAQDLARGALLNLFAAQELKARQAISDDELSYGLTDHADGPYCPPPPQCPDPQSRYRTIGGNCNNLANPNWGAVNSGFERILPPDYSDGIWAMKASSSGLPLPSPRLVSSALILEGNHPSPSHSMFFMQFGQFIAHDISAGVVFTTANGSAISCCLNDGEDLLSPDLQHWACAPITPEPNDIFYGQYKHRCINFVRTQLAPASDCSVGYAKQMNGATHFPDLSHLYGSNKEKSKALRGPEGFLAVFNDYGRELPPLTSRKECLSVNEGAACFDSGDHHGNQIITLTVLHTIFTREHNRIARGLSRLNPVWDEDTVYLEARRLVQAKFQHIIYAEWLPLLLGPQLIHTFKLSPSSGYSSTYDPHVNPSLTAEFSTAAMRFGHSTVDGHITVPNPSTNSIYETVSIPELMFQPSRLRLKHFLDRTLIGLSRQPMQSVDPFVTDGLTRYLFHGGNPFGLDLAAINIQRGRDWGVPSYNHYRRLIGLPTYDDFSHFSVNTAQRLASVYSSPEDIDLWVGGLLEEPVEGGIVGATFAHIIADQFSKLKNGDRYFYENGPDVNPGAFTLSQLAEIKKVTFARIICDNSDGVEPITLPPSAFLRADLPGNEPVTCDSYVVPTMDLSRFKEV